MAHDPTIIQHLVLAYHQLTGTLPPLKKHGEINLRGMLAHLTTMEYIPVHQAVDFCRGLDSFGEEVEKIMNAQSLVNK